jgi:hypothetical protein
MARLKFKSRGVLRWKNEGCTKKKKIGYLGMEAGYVMNLAGVHRRETSFTCA